MDVESAEFWDLKNFFRDNLSIGKHYNNIGCQFLDTGYGISIFYAWRLQYLNMFFHGPRFNDRRGYNPFSSDGPVRYGKYCDDAEALRRKSLECLEGWDTKVRSSREENADFRFFSFNFFSGSITSIVSPL